MTNKITSNLILELLEENTQLKHDLHQSIKRNFTQTIDRIDQIEAYDGNKAQS